MQNTYWNGQIGIYILLLQICLELKLFKLTISTWDIVGFEKLLKLGRNLLAKLLSLKCAGYTALIV